MIALIFLMLTHLASAATVSRNVAFSVNQTAPAASIPAAQPVVWDVVYGADESLPDLTVPSSWAPITCYVHNGIVAARFTATRATWPTSWPGSATCTVLVGPSNTTLVINLQITDCTGAECDREDYNQSTWAPAACPGTISVTSSGFSTHECLLPAPAAGKKYIAPLGSTKTVNGMASWSARLKVGATAAPDTDPLVAPILCRYGWYTDPTPDQYLLQAVVTETLTSDLTGAYCPMRLFTSATGVYSWGTNTMINVDRP